MSPAHIARISAILCADLQDLATDTNQLPAAVALPQAVTRQLLALVAAIAALPPQPTLH